MTLLGQESEENLTDTLVNSVHGGRRGFAREKDKRLPDEWRVGAVQVKTGPNRQWVQSPGAAGAQRGQMPARSTPGTDTGLPAPDLVGTSTSSGLGAHPLSSNQPSRNPSCFRRIWRSWPHCALSTTASESRPWYTPTRRLP